MTSNKKAVVIEFAAGQQSRGQELAQEHAQHVVQKLKDEDQTRQSSAVPARPAPRAQQPTQADEMIARARAAGALAGNQADVDEMILRARAAKAAMLGEDAPVMTYNDPIELKGYNALRTFQEMEREQARQREQDRLTAERVEKERREWRHPWFSKVPLIPLEEPFATVRTTPPDDPFHITPNFNL